MTRVRSQGTACPGQNGHTDSASDTNVQLKPVADTADQAMSPPGMRPNTSPVDPEADAAASAVLAAKFAEAENTVRLIEELNRGQRGSSWSLTVDPDAQARIPQWPGRQLWLQLLEEQLDTPAARALARNNHTSVSTVRAIAAVMAERACRHTGRRVAITTATIAAQAGLKDTSVVRRARRVLTSMGMAVEMARGRKLRRIEYLAAEAHHGGRQHKAASVWHLTVPEALRESARRLPRQRAAASLGRHLRNRRSAQPTAVQDTTPAHLSSSGSVLTSSLVGNNSPTRTRARAGRTSTKKTPATATQPRSLAVQVAAAELVANAPALGKAGHIGRLCEAITECGIDLSRWRGHDIARRLTADTQQRGWVWPAKITRPAAFLRWRLRGIDWSLPSPLDQSATPAEPAVPWCGECASANYRWITTTGTDIGDPIHRCTTCNPAASHPPRNLTPPCGDSIAQRANQTIPSTPETSRHAPHQSIDAAVEECSEFTESL